MASPLGQQPRDRVPQLGVRLDAPPEVAGASSGRLTVSVEGPVAPARERVAAQLARDRRERNHELAVHEEFDWLLQMVLQQERYRRAVARRMRSVADQVRAGDADGACPADERDGVTPRD